MYHFIYPLKDAYIYELNTNSEKNFGGDDNLVLKKDFDGVEISAKYGTTADGGGEEQNLSMIWGNSDANSSHTFIIDYFKREEILYADRDYSRSANQAALRGKYGGDILHKTVRSRPLCLSQKRFSKRIPKQRFGVAKCFDTMKRLFGLC